jgi:hypothetical protein
MRSATAPEVPKRSADGIANRDSLTGDRGFESISLQRRVHCEPDFLSPTHSPRYIRRQASLRTCWRRSSTGR